MIYVKRGLEKDLAMKVAQQLRARDRLGSHLRDELGINLCPCASVTSGVDFGHQLRIFRDGPDSSPPYRLSIEGHPRDLSGVLGQPRCAWCIWRPSRGRAAGRAALRVTIGGGLAMAVTAVLADSLVFQQAEDRLIILISTKNRQRTLNWGASAHGVNTAATSAYQTFAQAIGMTTVSGTACGVIQSATTGWGRKSRRLISPPCGA